MDLESLKHDPHFRLGQCLGVLRSIAALGQLSPFEQQLLEKFLAEQADVDAALKAALKAREAAAFKV